MTHKNKFHDNNEQNNDDRTVRKYKKHSIKGIVIFALLLVAAVSVLVFLGASKEGLLKGAEKSTSVEEAKSDSADIKEEQEAIQKEKDKAEAEKKKAEAEAEAKKAAEPTKEPEIDTSTVEGKYQYVLAHEADYPEALVVLTKLKPESAEVAFRYPELKDSVPPDTLDELVPGQIPRLLQWDVRWAYQMYGPEMMAAAGCGPTAVAMVAAGMRGDNTITPYKVAVYANDNGFNSPEGTYWSFMEEGCTAFGVRGRSISSSKESIYAELNSGHPIICSMAPGDFANHGHFVVLAGIENDQIRVHDPMSMINTEKLWDYDRVVGQIKSLWAYDVI